MAFSPEDSYLYMVAPNSSSIFVTNPAGDRQTPLEWSASDLSKIPNLTVSDLPATNTFLKLFIFKEYIWFRLVRRTEGSYIIEQTPWYCFNRLTKERFSSFDLKQGLFVRNTSPIPAVSALQSYSRSIAYDYDNQKMFSLNVGRSGGQVLRFGKYDTPFNTGEGISKAYLNDRFDFNQVPLENFPACLLYTSPSPRD